ncbi:MAG: EamA family transporter [Betaproteobacteria bacterium]
MVAMPNVINQKMLLSLKSISLFSISMLLYTLGNILFKKGMDRFPNSTLSGWHGYWEVIKQALTRKEILAGLVIFVLDFFVWLAFLSITPLNIAAPLSSVNNIFILLASAWFLKERISRKRWLGVALIITGMLFVGGNYA